jgi:hypothetical protein
MELASIFSQILRWRGSANELKILSVVAIMPSYVAVDE